MQTQIELFQMSKGQFLLIFFLFFSLISTSISYILMDEIYIFALRKYVEPEFKNEFGFDSEESEILFENHKTTAFLIKEVKSDSPMERAGFKSGDVPMLNVGCRFFMINRSNEAVFYGILMGMKNGQQYKFRVVNASDFYKASVSSSWFGDFEREVVLKKNRIYPCKDTE